MNWGQFKTWVGSVLNVGTTLDGVLDAYIFDAGRWLETNYTFLFQEKYRTFTQAAGNRYVTLTPVPKRIELFRQILSGGEFRNLNQEDPDEMDREDPNKLGSPAFFWLDGQAGSTTPQVARAVLNLVPTESMSIEMIEVVLTDYEAFPDTGTPWLVQYGRQAFLSQILYMLYTTPALYDQERAMAAQAARQDAVNILLNLDDELRQSVRNLELRYGRPF